MDTNEKVLSSLTRDDRLEGRTAVVTGSSSGLGEAIARVLAASGAHVVVHGRDRLRANTVTETINATGGRATTVLANLTHSPDATREFAAGAREALGGTVDILVNNAGIFPAGPTESLDDATVDELLATNIRVPHQLVAAYAPAMANNGTGAVVNISSWMARVGSAGVALYPATKAALEHLTRAWAAEYGPRGVRVNAVAPGATSTPGNAAASDVMDAIAAGTPAGITLRPVDIAWAVRYLASDEAAFVHGTTFDVDGGIVATRPS